MNNQSKSTKRIKVTLPLGTFQKLNKASLARYVEALNQRNEIELNDLHTTVAKYKAKVNAKRLRAGLPKLG